MELEHDRLDTYIGDVVEPSELEDTLEGADAAVVAIGRGGLVDTETRSVGTSNILDAMEHTGVDRIVVVSTIGVGDSGSQLSWWRRILVKYGIAGAVKDHERQEARVRGRDVDWTIVRPGYLSAKGPTGDYRADPDGKIIVSYVTRGDLADFILDALEADDTVEQTYALSV
jgi:nucleoside-diphosphate-sugar epimerase